MAYGMTLVPQASIMSCLRHKSIMGHKSISSGSPRYDHEMKVKHHHSLHKVLRILHNYLRAF
jgi:hypothetical protein